MVNVVVERAVRHGLNKVDAERVPERTKWISAFSVATPVLNVALIKYCIKSRFHELSFYQVQDILEHTLQFYFTHYELLSSEIILKYFFVLKTSGFIYVYVYLSVGVAEWKTALRRPHLEQICI